ncbi:PspC domain-containing protein [Riemerella anatipestifer]|uniref:Putative stress-responsive transcriptional regulator n=1 Tax=Riemerella anatipestifer RA-CH-1 TaxID=1228997 RepID=J9R4W4_RIEAN|nr:PspC domain-containing protein [Riemerella anatipestifer]AFR34777.1 Putative stress-responsive transcriptional regulator [Riemerella anatipestifer RA-CH-1]AIH01776.1 phage shock protein c, pspc [Riemerella anatipestifer CH3]MCO7331580.1 PspC domain-containing protein [Riemerella anatipestifer]MCO7350467.1 PspC domain-containing protein [Riemerella anatipestifer]MCQ4039580.1 PspC domain-containing protein [Riemerella anatipestifer]
MNKTLSIGLAGFSFMIEEHAYIKLSDYLKALRNSLDAEEADEIMYDIEIRIVEIFKESLGRREVVNDADVEKVIAQIGRPEQIEEQEEDYHNTQKTTQQRTKVSERQLFRDPERKKIAGVCAGMAAYFGMDMTAMRLIWLVLFLILIPLPGSPMLMVLVYVVFWIILPKATTAADFLKMRGEPLNFDNLKNESSKIVKFANDSTQRINEVYQDTRPVINEAGNSILNALRYVIGGFLGLLGLVFLAGAFMVFGVSVTGTGLTLPGFVGFYIDDTNIKFAGLALAFVTMLIPALIFIFLSIKLFSPKTKLKYVGYIIGALCFVWLVLLGITGFSAMNYQTNFRGSNEETDNIAINTTSDSLWVGTNKVNIPPQFKSYWNSVYSDNKTVFEEDGYPYIEIVRKDTVKTPYLVVKKRASGYNLPLRANIPVKVEGNKIFIPNYFSYPYQDRMRNYNVDYELVVPRTMKVLGMENSKVNLSEDDEDRDNQSNNSHSSNSKVFNQASFSFSSGGNHISFNTADSDSITVNGKKYDEKEAEKVIEGLNLDSDDISDIIISIKNRK